MNKEKLIVIVDFLDNYKVREQHLQQQNALLRLDLQLGSEKDNGIKQKKDRAGIYAVVFLNEKHKITPVKQFSQNTDPLKINLRQRVVFIHDRILDHESGEAETSPGVTNEKMYCEIMIFETGESGKPDLDNDKKIGK